MIEQKLLRLERMSSAEKVRHWGQEKPWELEGTRLKLPGIKGFFAAQVGLDDRGNIMRMPTLIGRPCFGQPTAYLRHGGLQFAYSQKGWQPTRCTKCAVRNACEFVAERRLQSTPKLAELYQEWRSLGGRELTWPKKGASGTAAVRYRELLVELQKLTFTSVNDLKAHDHYEAVIQKKLATDRERKRRAREAINKARTGEITPAVGQVLDGHRAWRAVEHIKACRHAEAPKCLRKLPIDTSRFDANVWTAYNRVKLRGETPNPYSCSVELHCMGLEQNRSINALRDRVKRSIERLHVLERLRLDGATEPVWPRFKRKDLTEGLEPLLPPTS